jgi:hypothetical protein
VHNKIKNKSHDNQLADIKALLNKIITCNNMMTSLQIQFPEDFKNTFSCRSHERDET